jgi:rubredoxin
METKTDQNNSVDLIRVPGLFRRHELRDYFADRNRFYHELSTRDKKGVGLYAVYVRDADDLNLDDCPPVETFSNYELPPELKCPLCSAKENEFEIVNEESPDELLVLCQLCGYTVYIPK